MEQFIYEDISMRMIHAANGEGTPPYRVVSVSCYSRELSIYIYQLCHWYNDHIYRGMIEQGQDLQ